MKKLSLLLLVFVSTFSFAQTEDALVFLEAKDPAVVSAALAAPITIMTQAAIDRKNAQGIAIDDRDVPLNETQKAAINAASGITVLAKSKWLNAVYVRGTENNINNLLSLPFVTDVEFADKSLNRPTAGKQFTKDKFEIENGFFYGAMYVSYGISIAIAVSLFMATYVLIPQMPYYGYIFVIIIGIVAFMPIAFRASRMIWMNLFSSYGKKEIFNK